MRVTGRGTCLWIGTRLTDRMLILMPVTTPVNVPVEREQVDESPTDPPVLEHQFERPFEPVERIERSEPVVTDTAPAETVNSAERDQPDSA